MLSISQVNRKTGPGNLRLFVLFWYHCETHSSFNRLYPVYSNRLPYFLYFGYMLYAQWNLREKKCSVYECVNCVNLRNTNVPFWIRIAMPTKSVNSYSDMSTQYRWKRYLNVLHHGRHCYIHTHIVRYKEIGLNKDGKIKM